MVYVRFWLLSFVVLVICFPADRSFGAAPIIRGEGTIVGGDTSRARREAVSDVMHQAMRLVIRELLERPASDEELDPVVEEQIVKKYQRFLKGYRIVKETAEGEFYRIRASVRLNRSRLKEELRSHGMMKSTLAPPKIFALVGIISKSDDLHSPIQRWWVQPAQGSKVPATAQLGLSRELKQYQTVVFRPPVILNQLKRSGDERALIAYNTRMAQQQLFEVAKQSQADYLVTGAVSADGLAVDLAVVNVHDRTVVGRITLQGKDWPKDQRSGDHNSTESRIRFATAAFHVAGAVHGNWLESHRFDERITVTLFNVQGPRSYQRVIESLKEIDQIEAIEDDRFKAQAAQIRIHSSVDTKELMRIMRADRKLSKLVTLKLDGEKRIRALLK